MPEETISKYLDLYGEYLEFAPDPTPGPWLRVRCPFHDDSTPSAGVSRKTGTLNCFVCGKFSPAEILIRVGGLSPKDAEILVDDFRYQNDLYIRHEDFQNAVPPPNPTWDRIYRQSLTQFSPDLPIVRWYAGARNISPDTMQSYGIGYLEAMDTPEYWDRDSLVFPYFYNGRVVGLRYRDEAGNKSGELKAYFTLFGIDRVEDDTEVILLCEGETDCLRIYQAVHNSPLSYTLNSGKVPVILSTPTAIFRREWVREIDHVPDILLLPQSDEAAVKMVKQVREFIPRAKVFELPWRRKESGNDVTDWLRYHEDTDLSVLLDRQLNRRKTRQIMTGYEFATEGSIPREWLVGGLLSRRQICLIGGQPKSKKTWLMLNLIRCLLKSEAFCGISSLTPQFPVTPKMLIWEEEGAIQDLYERVEMVFTDIDEHQWKGNTFWAHHLGLRLDSDDWLERLSKYIEELGIEVLVLDPFSRTYAVNEDSAAEMGEVWSRVQTLLTDHENLTIIILHHFNKTGTIGDRWAAFRGSSRTAAEVDVGIFVESLPAAKGEGIRFCVEGRSIPPLLAPDGSDIFYLDFHDGIFNIAPYQALSGKADSLILYLESNPDNMAKVSEIAKALRKTETSIRKMVSSTMGTDGKPLCEFVDREENVGSTKRLIEYVKLTYSPDDKKEETG